MAFAVGPFEFVPAGFAGKNKALIRIVTPKSRAGEAKYAAEVTATILKLESAMFATLRSLLSPKKDSAELSFGAHSAKVFAQAFAPSVQSKLSAKVSF